MAVDRIHPNQPAQGAQQVDALKSNAKPVTTEETGSKDKLESPKGDRVDISDRSREVQQVRNKIDLTPDIRPEKVQAAKQAIANHMYNVRGEQVAEKMLGGAILNSLS